MKSCFLVTNREEQHIFIMTRTTTKSGVPSSTGVCDFLLQGERGGGERGG